MYVNPVSGTIYLLFCAVLIPTDQVPGIIDCSSSYLVGVYRRLSIMPPMRCCPAQQPRLFFAVEMVILRAHARRLFLCDTYGRTRFFVWCLRSRLSSLTSPCLDKNQPQRPGYALIWNLKCFTGVQAVAPKKVDHPT